LRDAAKEESGFFEKFMISDSGSGHWSRWLDHSRALFICFCACFFRTSFHFCERWPINKSLSNIVHEDNNNDLVRGKLVHILCDLGYTCGSLWHPVDD